MAEAPDETQFLSRKRNRKLSWVGVDEDTPYAFLRESMVSSLMGGICDPQFVSAETNPRNLRVEPDRKKAVAEAVGSWSFSAHNFTDDELVYGDLCMLEHALQMDELEHWRMSTDELTSFLLASRAAYNDFVLYHNFRHVSDVLQAIFFFLVSIGILPPYPTGSKALECGHSAIADLLRPIDGLTLLISAIGHDVGHPGVNNAFLVALNAPLAQLYNDRSVLESFHCAAYSQILRRYWPQTFSDTKMRKLMIDSILATDMGLHFKYMSDLGNLQEKLAHNSRTTDGWNEKILMEYRELTCGLLIKCADISNVARKFDVAAKWANILTDEFSNQGRMENRLNIPTCLFGGPPVRDDYIKLGQSQIGFMNVFARPLFEAVTDVLPGMQFSVDELAANKSRWDSEIAKEKERQIAVAASNPKSPGLLHLRGMRGGDLDGTFANPSPKSGSTEFLIPPHVQPPTSAPTSFGSDSKSTSDPSPFASIEAQADAKRRMFNPNNIEFGGPGESNTSTGTTNASPSYPSSRRGSADPSLTTILVTEQAPGTPTKDGKNFKTETWTKRGSVDSQSAAAGSTAPDHLRNGSSSSKHRHKSPPAAAAAASPPPPNEQDIPVAPEENAASVADARAWQQRSDALATGAANGMTISPGALDQGLRVGRQGPGKKSQSTPAALNVRDTDDDDGDDAGEKSKIRATRSQTRQTTSEMGGSKKDGGGSSSGSGVSKSSFGKFWKKRWRAVSGVASGGGHDGSKEGMKSRERLAASTNATTTTAPGSRHTEQAISEEQQQQ